LHGTLDMLPPVADSIDIAFNQMSNFMFSMIFFIKLGKKTHIAKITDSLFWIINKNAIKKSVQNIAVHFLETV